MAPPSRSKKDETAAILKGLQLDKSFFDGLIRVAQSPALPSSGVQPTSALAAPRTRESFSVKSVTETLLATRGGDFDLYLGAAVMPVLAQALDALVRQITRMKGQGENLDPKMRARFNPLTFLAQQLLRRHPKSSLTPRRQAVYSNFSTWADRERGRREMLRRRGLIESVFSGFMVRRAVRADCLVHVLGAIDDTLRLEGVLKGNIAMLEAFPLQDADSEFAKGNQGQSSQQSVSRAVTHSAVSSLRRATLGGWGFEQFWAAFSGVIRQNDVVLYSAIERGMRLQQAEIGRQLDVQAQREKQETERKEREAEQHKLIQEYAELRSQIKENEHLVAILEEDKILTGDDVRKGDTGFEFEVPPCGMHVDLLAKLLEQLGFTVTSPSQVGLSQNVSINISRASPGCSDDDSAKNSSVVPSGLLPSGLLPSPLPSESSVAPPADTAADDAFAHRWWDADLANAWCLLQKLLNAEMADGVVEREVLERLLVPPAAFLVLRGRVEEELDHLESDKILDMDGLGDVDQPRAGKSLLQNVMTSAHAEVQPIHHKPTMEDLCRRLNTSMTRMRWLHKMFESFLESEDAGGQPPCCGYPDNPASLTVKQMRELMGDINPDLTDAMFDAHFRRVDEDGSGKVEFDEFIKWCMENEVRIDEGTSHHTPSFAELAESYGEPHELIIFLHGRFEEHLPDDEIDRYPEEPKSLPREEVQSLLHELMPDTAEEALQEALSKLADDSSSSPLEVATFTFDRFLEMLDWQALSEDFRMEALENNSNGVERKNS